MNTQEAAYVLRKVQAYRPAQMIDRFTVEAWQEALDDIRVEDALFAVGNLGKDSGDFLTPAEIRTEVRRIRQRRLEERGSIIPPRGLSQAEERKWLRKAYRRVGDGETVADGERGELKPRPPLTAIGHRL